MNLGTGPDGPDWVRFTREPLPPARTPGHPAPARAGCPANPLSNQPQKHSENRQFWPRNEACSGCPVFLPTSCTRIARPRDAEREKNKNGGFKQFEFRMSGRKSDGNERETARLFPDPSCIRRPAGTPDWTKTATGFASILGSGIPRVWTALARIIHH